MSNLFNKAYFNALDELSEEEKQQLLAGKGAADVVKNVTLGLFGPVGFSEEEKAVAQYDHVASDAASFEDREEEV